jgi:hypothetical protein
MGRLVKIGFPFHTLTVRPGSGPYVHHVMMGCTSDTTPYVCYVGSPYVGSQGEPHFLSTVHLFSNSYGYSKHPKAF